MVIIINQLNNLITYIIKYIKYTHKKKMLKTFIFTLIINYTIFFVEEKINRKKKSKKGYDISFSLCDHVFVQVYLMLYDLI